MKTSESIAALAAALAKAQGEIDTAKKDANNPHFKTKYADLASVWDACRGALSKNSVAVVQAPGTDDSGAVTMTTTLAHSSGEWMSSTMACKPAKQDAQAIGSVITYLRRYALASMVGVAPEEDDGNAASGRGDMAPTGRQKPQEQDNRPAAPPPPAAEPIVLFLAEGEVREFHRTLKGAEAYFNALDDLIRGDRYFWTANAPTAEKLSSDLMAKAPHIARLLDGIKAMLVPAAAE